MPKRILVVDDDLLVLKSLTRLFNKEGYHVATAKSGKEALEKVEKEDFDLVVVDIRMPELDGIETTRRIKECCRKKSAPEVPVIFITGYSDIEAHTKAKELGEVVLKPFDLEKFLSLVNESSSRRRVVITGIGVIAPNGIGKDEFWDASIAGKSGVRKIESFDTSGYNSKIAAQVLNFNPRNYMPEAIAKRTDRYAHLGIAAAKIAIEDSRLDIEKEDKYRIGVCIGTGLGGILFHEEQIAKIKKGGPGRAHPLCVPKISPNAVPSQIAIQLGLKGVNLAISTACASSTNAIGQAFDMIRLKRADIVITGGAEAPLTPFTFAAYDSLKVLSSKRNGMPQEASRPFDKERDGFVMGEGAAGLIIEDLEHARARGAHIYAEVIGYGTTSGAYHMVMPDPTGDDAAKVMQLAIKEANINPEDIDYINAHGTSTQVNDRVETQAIKAVFGKNAYRIPISSTKSMMGHLIGAAGAVEAIVCALAIENSIIPPTVNYQHKDPECDLDYVPNEARKQKVDIALSNSFGFGSCNACIVLRRCNG
ncbi:MAG: beta-ketoacyl-ACP synthase II [Candidatus Omnitrophota bacterium]|nr:MAG: beta-ketoacyl-ACP synthase II [Candidatus Omnitrophota bacterium]